MPATTAALVVAGSVETLTASSAVLLLDERLRGRDTFLTGRLELGSRDRQVRADVSVRILTFDDVTVLRVAEALPGLTAGGRWSGTLHLPHGWRTVAAPADLIAAARTAERDLAALDEAELRYAVTFLTESTTDEIRRGRIGIIVASLPPVTTP
ncbi:hypothetical protein SAMN05660350_00415 [Geodermatophilus obscurus]|uniref:Uncharacterized protein n=1 Tax=Geodermatophilus obscurus TaxID=1861 RepID=A0A1M7S2I9_9ACTN|nr:hypothetical protein [Geodermatophilus obscurus]SHN52678.1 hypothetical protein SAMN05660350_00415 [Geodermatophilus obscurus]